MIPSCTKSCTLQEMAIILFSNVSDAGDGFSQSVTGTDFYNEI